MCTSFSPVSSHSALNSAWHKAENKCQVTPAAHLESLKANSFPQAAMGPQATPGLASSPSPQVQVSNSIQAIGDLLS